MVARHDEAVQEVTHGVEVRMGDSSFSTARDHVSSNGVDISMQLESLTLTSQSSTRTSPPQSVPEYPKDRRPLDDVREAGPAADPIPFPAPVFARGRRCNVLVYNPNTQLHYTASDVLFRDYSREYGDDCDGCLNRVQKAYRAVPEKEHINTIMGHVQICNVLERCTKDCGSEDDDDSDSDDDEDEEDIVFQMTNQYVAIKVNYCDRMQRMKNKHAEDPLKEVAAMQLIGNDHPNVLGCYEVLFDGKNLNVVMPYCMSGDLFSMLQENMRLNPEMPGLSEPRARYWFRQIVDGLNYIHARGICHRDLSPENIMIDRRGCLIIDMGMCLRIPYSTRDGPPEAVTDITHGTWRRLIKPQGACGKLPYMSPEIYRNREAFDGGAVDVWTIATILFCMLTGNRSYEKPHASDPQFYWMTHGLSQLLEDWGVVLSDDAVDLLKDMLQVDPRLRLTLEEVTNHPWFQHADEPAGQAQTMPHAHNAVLTL